LVFVDLIYFFLQACKFVNRSSIFLTTARPWSEPLLELYNSGVTQWEEGWVSPRPGQGSTGLAACGREEVDVDSLIWVFENVGRRL